MWIFTILSLAYIAFVIMIYIGSGYLTEIIFGNNTKQLECINLTDITKLNIAKMTIVMFWLIFTGLFLSSIYIVLKYTGFILPILKRKSQTHYY